MRRKGIPVTDDKTPIAGDRLGQGEPGRPAVGRGPNAGGGFSQEDYHHPAAGWGAIEAASEAAAAEAAGFACTSITRRYGSLSICAE